MKKPWQLFLLALSGMMGGCMPPVSANDQQNVYDLSFTTLMGEEPMPLSAYEGKVVLVVNTASKCGFTPQFKGLQELYDKYKGQGLVILGVPSNDFGGQEPGTDEQISQFCKLNYGVTFPMASKQVVTGDKAHPFYKRAYAVFGFGSAPKWNFYKYLVSRDGKLVEYFSSKAAPDSEALVKAIEQELSKEPT